MESKQYSMEQGLNPWKANNTPWNKGLQQESLPNDEPLTVIQRVSVDEVPVSHRQDLSESFRLRPKKEKSDVSVEENATENIIVDFSKVQELVNIVQQHDASCKGAVRVTIASRRGLLIYCRFMCN
jgi:hypothetical protein